MTRSLTAGEIATVKSRITPARTGRDRLDRVEEVFGLRDMLLDYVTETPRLPHYLFDALRADYGSVGERRLWRVLSWLVARGKVVRVGGTMTSKGGYVLSQVGGAETADEIQSRRRLKLCARGKCYRCKLRIKSGPYCTTCALALRAEGERRRAAARRLRDA